ncbi:MAG: J domain-containing protein [Isosphaeraceae bacterium]
MDPYRLLGISPSCTLEELKQAYRVKVRQAHPDLGGNESAFIAVCEAYRQVLEELARRPAARGSSPARSQDRDSTLLSSDRIVRPDRRPSKRRDGRRRTPKPPDPLWNPELILGDQPIWIGHPGRPPDPDWDPELILLDEPTEGPADSPAPWGIPEGSDSAFPPEAINPARSARRRRELSSRELVLGIIILLCMMAIIVAAFLQIVWQGGAQPGP